MFKNLENFLDVYFTNWVKALEGNEKMYVSDDGKWTNFHMEKILYPLAEELLPEGSDCGYKEIACSDCPNLDKDCKNLKRKYTTPCRYGETWSQEYYRVDLGLYRYPNAENGLWAPDYLIEHENAHLKLIKSDDGYAIKKTRKGNRQKGWFGEFVKLLPINCSSYGARVIISYCNFDEKDENVATYEEFLLHVLNHETVKQTLCEKPILILLGPSKTAIKRKKDPAESFYFMMFAKDGTKWKHESGFFEREDVKKIFRRLRENCNKRRQV